MPKKEQNAKKEIADSGAGHEWIKTRLKEVGKKVKDLADATGQPASRISEKISGKRDFQVDEIPPIARQLELPVNVVWSRLPTSGGGVLPEDSMLVEIHGAVKAGKWTRAVKWDQKDWKYILAPKDTQHSFVYALRVMGDDMALVYPPECTVILYVPYEHYKNQIGNGDHVVVQRDDGNGQFEVTVKEVSISDDGRIMLEPRSNNLDYKAIQLYKTDGAPTYYGTEDLKITGVVLNAMIERAPPAADKKRVLPAHL
ncbi:MAG TPA: S24 family peptidase [Alphaproteobacteria bacterium]|nr:S24 family peptidase [Alphaproteobacteria bacterium]